MTSRWEPGSPVVHTETWRGRLWAARPMRVVEDSDDGLFLWMPCGTRRLVPEGGHAAVIDNLARGTWAWTRHVWDLSTLAVVRPGDGFAVWASWLPDGTHFGYYVNFQRPLQRTPAGYEAMDLMLDITVDPDLTWRWKDEDEFQACQDQGLYDAELVTWVRSEADRALDLLARRAFPFDGSLLARRPDGSRVGT